jgi:D-tagatose-1,6-bisphosphate aldolase subunit GatZ/KbaZ
MSAVSKFLKILHENREGKGSGIYSICSAQPTVLKASMLQAKKDKSIILIESTSNQVDQFGGYTGMTPSDFVNFVYNLADEVDFSKDDILLGGDHLGPNTWQSEDASSAMKKALVLIEEYVKAGYQKIHLDASMFCADDEGDRHQPLPNNIVAERAALMAKIAEETHIKFCKDKAKPVYIIGTEVPIPGGAQEEEDVVLPTSSSAALETIKVTKAAFEAKDLTDAWSRVCGVVVQPGVEFGDDQVFHYNRNSASGLSKTIISQENLVYEAHSTDYQSENGLTQLVEDHFCILKVGPWLTFGYREALFSLSMIEEEMFSQKEVETSNLRAVIEEVMLDDSKYWRKYYSGDESQQQFKRKYSFSDRSRYYWPNEKIQSSIKKLIANLEKHPISLSLLSQYMPNQYTAINEGIIKNNVNQIILNKTQEVISLYARSCKLSK